MTLFPGVILLTDSHVLEMPHDKLAVVLSEKTDGWVGLCIINTDASTETKKKNFQIKLLSKNYQNFLTHDSYIDCGEVKQIKKDVIDFWHNEGKIGSRGSLKEEDFELVRNAGKNNISFNKREKSYFEG
jgi:hypothetical protein